MWKTKRMNPMEFFGGHGCKDAKGLQSIFKKTREIEDAYRLLQHTHERGLR